MSGKENLAFEKKNYVLMGIGIAVILLGFIIMTLDAEPYGFGFLGITLGPVILCIGFAIQFYAILYKAKKSE